ncbi:MAG: hypothetical protein QGI45_06930 [Myxococcota bacterium]|nr:hypothetical protein [Myxococcota bacterium]
MMSKILKPTTTTHFTRLSLIIAALTFYGCHSCESAKTYKIWDFVPAQSALVLEIESIQAMAEGFARYFSSFSQDLPQDIAAKLQHGLKESLGFDPGAPETFKKFGLDIEKPWIVFSAKHPLKSVVVAPLNDFSAFQKTLENILAKEFEISFKHEKYKTFDIQTAGRPFGAELAPVLHFVRVGQFIMLAHPEARAELEKALSGLQSTPKNHHRAARGFLAELKSYPLRIYALKTSAEGQKDTSKTTQAGLRLDEKGLAGTLVMPDPWAKKTGGEASKQTQGLTGNTPAMLKLQTQAFHQEGYQILKSLGGDALLKRFFNPIEKATGLSVETDLLALFSGPMQATMNLQKMPKIPKKLKGLHAKQLLHAVETSVSAQLKAPEKMLPLLLKLKETLLKRGVHISHQSMNKNGLDIHLFESFNAQTKKKVGLGWAVVGDTYLYATGDNRIHELVEARSAKSPVGTNAPQALFALDLNTPLLIDKVSTFLKTNMPGQQAALFAFVLQIAGRFGPAEIQVQHQSPNLHMHFGHAWNAPSNMKAKP